MNKQLLQPLTDQVLSELRTLIGAARHASLAVSEKGTGHPAISRVALSTKADGTPVLLTSALAPHTAALEAEGRCSLLIGDVGKGDPMAHPRVTLFCTALRVPDIERAAMREGFLSHHPKAINYIDLPDFGFWKLSVERASYNAGFGKAYSIKGAQLVQ
ncbi:MAG: HugZ family protein [Devosiaceae bacterium]|nr:HugZ family protein [Devosiaceae bacterium]